MNKKFLTRKLKIQVSSNKKFLPAREKVILEISTTDNEERPVSVELSF